MSFVLDASVTLAWCLPDEATRYTNAVLASLKRERAIVPVLWVYEVANALATGIRKGRTTRDAARAFREVLDALPIDIHPPPALSGRSAERLDAIAAEQNVSTYDAAYLVVALDLGLPLATLDGTGRREGVKHAAQRLGVKLLVAE